MVEVPLEIEAELPRDFEGAALLSSSGLPRKVRLKAQRDALKLSTAYRADQLLADLVKIALRGTPQDVERVQNAARNFVRAVRERRQDGATLIVESNGRGRIEVTESMPPPPGAARAGTQPAPRPGQGTLSDRMAAVERRLAEIESGFARLAPHAEDSGDRVSNLERRLLALEERPQGPGVGEPKRGLLKGRGTAIEAFADGFRGELRDRVSGHLKAAEGVAARCDKAAALAVEAERVLRAPAEGISDHLRAASGQAAAREQALERVHAEVELYAAADLPLAERLVSRLLEGPQLPDPTGPLERQAQSLVRAARGANPDELRAWLSRAAALFGWELIDPRAGEPVSPQLHVAVDSGGDRVARVAAAGVRRRDGSVLCRARVQVSAEARAAEAADAPADDSGEVELIAEETVEVTPPPVPPAAESGEPQTKRFAAASPTSSATATSNPASTSNPTATSTSNATDEGPVEPPLKLPGREARDVERPAAPRTAQPVQVVEPPPPTESAPAAPSGDDLALATEVAAAVDTEVAADPEWAQMARGPQAFKPPQEKREGEDPDPGED